MGSTPQFHTGVGIRDRVPGIPQSWSRKSGTGTGTGTHFKIWDWERDSNSKFAGSGTGTGTQICGTRDSGTQLWGTVPGTENFPGHGPGPVPTPAYDHKHENAYFRSFTNSKLEYVLNWLKKVLRGFRSFFIQVSIGLILILSIIGRKSLCHHFDVKIRKF